MADGQTPQPQPTTTPATSAPNFDSIPDHQIHDESTIGPANPAAQSHTSNEMHALGMIPYTEPEELQNALDKVTTAIENYTQGGRDQNPSEEVPQEKLVDLILNILPNPPKESKTPKPSPASKLVKVKK